MKYFKINKALDLDLKRELVLFAKSNAKKYYQHDSTISGTYTNLNFLFTEHKSYDIINKMFPVEGNTIALLNIAPNKIIEPHTDGVELKRDTCIIFPLWPDKEKYAPCFVDDQPIPYMDCYAFSTQNTHWIRNNEFERFSLQIFYDMKIEELYERLKKVDGIV